MVFLRGLHFDFPPLIRRLTVHRLRWLHLDGLRRPFHIQYPHLILGLIFLIVLLALLFALPASADTRLPYLSVNDIPAGAPTWLADQPQLSAAYPVSVDSLAPVPVTGR